MLVLKRKPNESVCIGDDIEVFVIRDEGNQLKLGFKAPPGVKIRRSELPIIDASGSKEHKPVPPASPN